MSGKAKIRGQITYDNYFGHVCTCTAKDTKFVVAGFEGDHAEHDWTTFEQSVEVVREVEPTESGSYYYRCSRCGAGGWSGL